MYTPYSSKKDMARIQKAINLLSNPDEFEKVALKMIQAYRYSCEHNLSNPSMNKIAYIGQASCFFAHDIREDETRAAWAYLTDDQRNAANAVAEKVLRIWENEYLANHA